MLTLVSMDADAEPTWMYSRRVSTMNASLKSGLHHQNLTIKGFLIQRFTELTKGVEIPLLKSAFDKATATR